MHCENLLSQYIKIFKEENNSKQIYNSSKKKINIKNTLKLKRIYLSILDNWKITIKIPKESYFKIPKESYFI